jgi:hypothetical protein
MGCKSREESSDVRRPRDPNLVRGHLQIRKGALFYLCRGVGSREGMSVLSTRLVFDLGIGAVIGSEDVDIE